MSSQEMDVDTPNSVTSDIQQATEHTPSTRISSLNEIDTSISTLLTSASTAIHILSSSNPSTSSSLSSQQTKFQTAAQTYFSTLSSIEVRLRRQVYALEEAGLIPAGNERDTRRGRNLNNDGGGTRSQGGGFLDPSWLNARMDNGVEEGKKRELLDEGRRFVQGMRGSEAGEGE